MSFAVLPLHVWDRELDSRIFLASLLLKHNRHIIIGHEYNLSPFYKLYQNIFTVRAGRPMYSEVRTKWSQQVIANNGYVGLIYEEGINDITWSEVTPIVGVTKQSISSTSRLYSWCQLEANQFIESCSNNLRDEIREKTKVCSNPRLELCGSIGMQYYQEKATALRSIFGNYILISDNFGLEYFTSNDSQISPFNDLKDRVQDEEILGSIMETHDNIQKVKYQSRDRFIECINEIISAYPQFMFIFRPHPVANPNIWHNKLKNARNLQIIYQDSIEPWINGARCVIHAGCTVGLQSMLCKVPTIDISKMFNDLRKEALSTKIAEYRPINMSEFKETMKIVFNYKTLPCMQRFSNNCENARRTGDT